MTGSPAVLVWLMPELMAMNWIASSATPPRNDGVVVEGDAKPLPHIIMDVVICNHTLCEIRLHADTMGIKTLYREQFGRHLFRDDDFFPDHGPAKYTLEPLRRDGLAALVCADVEGLDWVRLRELKFNFYKHHEKKFQATPKVAWRPKFSGLDLRRDRQGPKLRDILMFAVRRIPDPAGAHSGQPLRGLFLYTTVA